MACNKWEEIGLLYCSRELNTEDDKLFEHHLEECSECKCEYEQYTNEKKTVFTLSILGETPPKHIDDEIVRVCSTAKKQYTGVGFFSGFVKKTVYSMSFFLLGFVVVGYFIFNAQNANVKSTQYSMQPLNNASAQVLAKQESATLEKDSIKDSAVYFSRNRGNLQTNGVYPVDLK